ncbi:hypothetical protein FOZ61_007737 [Perkinsus olseni]|nr:hypothetical protein FOZ61_007737 [Perkinsus olseni]
MAKKRQGRKRQSQGKAEVKSAEKVDYADTVRQMIGYWNRCCMSHRRVSRDELGLCCLPSLLTSADLIEAHAVRDPSAGCLHGEEIPYLIKVKPCFEYLSSNDQKSVVETMLAMARNGVKVEDVPDGKEGSAVGPLTLDAVPSELISLIDECIGLEKIDDELDDPVVNIDVDEFTRGYPERVTDCPYSCPGRMASPPLEIAELITKLGWMRVSVDPDCLTGASACTVHNKIGVLLRPLLPPGTVNPPREMFKTPLSMLVDAVQGRCPILRRPNDAVMVEDDGSCRRQCVNILRCLDGYWERDPSRPECIIPAKPKWRSRSYNSEVSAEGTRDSELMQLGHSLEDNLLPLLRSRLDVDETGEYASRLGITGGEEDKEDLLLRMAEEMAMRATQGIRPTTPNYLMFEPQRWAQLREAVQSRLPEAMANLSPGAVGSTYRELAAELFEPGMAGLAEKASANREAGEPPVVYLLTGMLAGSVREEPARGKVGFSVYPGIKGAEVGMLVVSKYGDEEALALATECRRNAELRGEVVASRSGTCPKQSGVVGVQWKRPCYWVAKWRVNGKAIEKRFSVEKYGSEEAALEAAIACRRSKVPE